jgi:DNA-binding IclR family transcriptional regulator
MSPSVISRVLAILNLFRAGRPWISIDDIAAALGVSPASAYRYASELSQGGLLSRTSGRYRLGPKIIELEYLVREYDPIIQAAQDLMNGIAELTGQNVLLCNVYDGAVVNVAHVAGRHSPRLTYTRGLPLPPFRGAQAHIILAHTERRKLRKRYESAAADPALASDVAAIGADWRAFAAQMKEVRARGYYISRNQLDQGVTGIAAPVFGEDGEIVGSLVLSMDAAAPATMSEDTLVGLVVHGANEITRRIGQTVGQDAPQADGKEAEARGRQRASA